MCYMYYILCSIPRKATLKNLILFTTLPEAVRLKGFVVYVLLILVSNMITSYTCSFPVGLENFASIISSGSPLFLLLLSFVIALSQSRDS